MPFRPFSFWRMEFQHQIISEHANTSHIIFTEKLFLYKPMPQNHFHFLKEHKSIGAVERAKEIMKKQALGQ